MRQETPQRGTASNDGALDKTHRFEYSLHPEKKLVVVKFGQKLRFRDVERYVHLVQADPRFEPTFAEIVDLRNVEEVAVSAEEFLKLADELDPFAVTAKRAFVVRTSAQNHAARMHKILRTQRNIEIFEKLEQAERWIRS